MGIPHTAHARLAARRRHNPASPNAHASPVDEQAEQREQCIRVDMHALSRRARLLAHSRSCQRALTGGAQRPPGAAAAETTPAQTAAQQQARGALAHAARAPRPDTLPRRRRRRHGTRLWTKRVWVSSPGRTSARPRRRVATPRQPRDAWPATRGANRCGAHLQLPPTRRVV